VLSISSALAIELVPAEQTPRRLPWGRRRPIDDFVAFRPPDPGRVPLLEIEQGDLMDRGRHPFYRAAEADFFLARRGGRVVGRVAALINRPHNAHEGVRHGFFGFYEAIDDPSVADALLDTAAGWLRTRGMTEMWGPASPSHNYYYGCRARSEELAPATAARFMEQDNPDYYNSHFRRWGLNVERRLFGYDAELASPRVQQVAARFERSIRETIRATGLQIRRLEMDDYDAEITRAVELINVSLAENFGFSPMTRPELAYMAEQLRLVIDPRLVLFVELGDQPVGISLAIPDYNQLFTAMDGRLSRWLIAFRYANVPFVRALWPHGNAWTTQQIDVVRVIALGVPPTIWRASGAVRRELVRLGPALIFATFDNARQAGYKTLTASWIHEGNRAMRAPFDLVGLQPTRVWNAYRRAL